MELLLSDTRTFIPFHFSKLAQKITYEESTGERSLISHMWKYDNDDTRFFTCIPDRILEVDTTAVMFLIVCKQLTDGHVFQLSVYSMDNGSILLFSLTSGDEPTIRFDYYFHRAEHSRTWKPIDSHTLNSMDKAREKDLLFCEQYSAGLIGYVLSTLDDSSHITVSVCDNDTRSLIIECHGAGRREYNLNFDLRWIIDAVQ